MTAAPAAELRQAAQRLRDLAAAATPGPWRSELLPPNLHHRHPAHWVTARYEDDGCEVSQTVADCPWRQADADLIAALHPGVAVALADWLETAATYLGDEPQVTYPSHVVRALAVARQILGTPAAKEAHDA